MTRSQWKAQQGHLEEGKSHKANKKHEKRQNKTKWQRRAKKSSKTQQAHKAQKLPLNQLPLTLSMQALPLI
jgi:hypothetical protein